MECGVKKLQITLKFQMNSQDTKRKVSCDREKGVFTLKEQWQDHTGNKFPDVPGTIVQRNSINQSITWTLSLECLNYTGGLNIGTAHVYCSVNL